jgi:cytoskeletal protein CcmA (bactofilin family)
LRRGAALAAAALMLVLAASLVLGKGELLGGKLRTGDTVTVPADETWDGDLYLLGGRVTVAGTVDGDLTVLGGQVDVSGTVTGDVLMAGGNVSIAGNVGGDARVAGGQINLGGTVHEDVAVTGGQVTVPAGGTIDGDLIVAGGQVTMSGSVGGSVEGSAGTYSAGGTVGGTEHVVLARNQPLPARASEPLLDALRQFVVVFLFGALLLWLLPRFMAAAGRVLHEQPWRALGGGLLACVGYIAFLIAAIIAMVLAAILFGVLQVGSLVAIDVIGGLLAIFVVTFLFVLTVAFAADALVGLTVARWAATRMATGTNAQSRWQELGLLAAGAAVVVIVTSIPIIGGWLKLAVILFGLGAFAIAWWHGWRSGGEAAPVA